MNRQVCIIHGGDTFPSHDEYLAALREKELVYERLLYAPSWRSWIAEQLTGYDVIMPSMPNKQNAQYAEWALYFSKVVPFLKPSAVLIGHSLGGIFLAKYLSEHVPHEPYTKLILLAPPYDDETNESLGDFRIETASRLVNAATEIHIMHSKDDPVVPYSESTKYTADLPGATLHTFTDKHHFIDSTLPELLDIIEQ